MEQQALKTLCNYLNTNIYPYLETSDGQSSNLYLNEVHFSTTVLIRHLWQLKAAVFPQKVSIMHCSIGLSFLQYMKNTYLSIKTKV
jgi:hypothetical protein